MNAALVLACAIAGNQMSFVRIIDEEGHSTSGTVLASGLILTCDHGHEGKLNVRLNRGALPAYGSVEVVYRDPDRDLCLIRARVGSNKGFPVATRSPAIGETVRVAGFGHKNFVERKTQIIGSSGQYLRAQTVGRYGDSGGAVTYQGQLVGIVVRHAGSGIPNKEGDALFVPAETIVEFLRDAAEYDYIENGR